jgi:hypothetical protein
MGVKMPASLRKVKLNTNNTRDSNFTAINLATILLTKLPFGGL